MESNNFFSQGYVRLLASLVLVAAVTALGSYTYLTLKQAKGVYTGDTTVSVSGSGEVLAKPDIGQFSFAVRSEGETATEAQDQSAEAINAIISYLDEAGVAENDIKTQNYNLNPKYRYEERVCPAGTSYCPPGEQVVDGYVVSQNVSVKVRELESAGDLISGVGERGATNISSLNFTIDDETVLQAEAREKAIADAREKAQQLAENLGMEVSRVVGFHENEGRYPIYEGRGYGGDMAMAESSMAQTAPAVPTGENTITSNVSLTVELK